MDALGDQVLRARVDAQSPVRPPRIERPSGPSGGPLLTDGRRARQQPRVSHIATPALPAEQRPDLRNVGGSCQAPACEGYVGAL